MNAWCRKNTGSFGDTACSMWPPTQTCTRLCRFGVPNPSSAARNPPVELSVQGGVSYGVRPSTVASSVGVGRVGVSTPIQRAR
jgi:hypothetical protein